MNFADDTTILSDEINCFATLRPISETILEGLQLKNKLFKKPGIMGRAYENRNDKLGKMIWSQFSTKMLRTNFGNSILNINDWDI